MSIDSQLFQGCLITLLGPHQKVHHVGVGQKSGATQRQIDYIFFSIGEDKDIAKGAGLAFLAMIPGGNGHAIRHFWMKLFNDQLGYQ
jgi:hypothetical protein